jgi:putative SOS response-associated peptidase YedK
MPVILPAGAYAAWLDSEVTSIDKLLPLLKPYPAEAMTAVPVSLRMHNPRFDDPGCVAEVTVA